MRVARTWRLCVVSVLAVVASQLAPLAANATGNPSVVITSPTVGANLAGVVTVTGTGTIDPGDTYDSLQLYVQGSPVGSPTACPTTDPTTCTASFTYDFTDFAAASYTLNLVFVTTATGAGGVMSPDVSVNVTSPPPAAAVTSPTVGTTQQGVVSIATSGTVDASQTNTATSLQLMIDGATTGSTFSCPGPSHTCSHAFSYDFTGSTTGRTLGVRFVSTAKPTGTHVVDSPAISINTNSPAPVTAISSPNSGDGVTGNVAVVSNGTVDATQTDSAATMQLYVNAVAYGSPTACPTSSGPKACPVTLNWDATGLPANTYSLSTHFTTLNGRTADSAPVSVNLTVPAPTVVINSPADQSLVSGASSVSATATVDATLSDYPATIQLKVDGIAKPAQACPGSAKVCTLSLAWDATGLTGSHTLQVVTVTHNGVTAQSTTISVAANSTAPTATIVSPAYGATVSGVTTINALGVIAASQTDLPTSLQLMVDGAVRGAAISCPAGQSDPKQCPIAFSYDFTGLKGPHQVAVAFVTHTTTVQGVVSVVSASSPAPTVSVASPAAGASVSGVVQVALTGLVDSSQTDTPTSLQLTVDGAALGAPVACPVQANPRACAVTVPWDATGLTGTHVLAGVLVTGHTPSTSSAQVTVTVANRAPTATIVSPAAGATITGVVSVVFSGAVDPNLTDGAKSATLSIDGVVHGTAVTCPASADGRSCAATFSVNTVGLAGPHTLAVTFLTKGGQQAVASAKVFVFSATKTTLAKLAPAAYGHNVVVKGTVVAIGSGFGLGGQPVKVTFTPAVGKPRTLVVHTGGSGAFAAVYKVVANTVVTATLAGPAYYGVSHAAVKIGVVATVSCAKASGRHGAAVVGSCKAPGVAKGAAVTLQVKVGSRWVAIGKARAAAGKVTYTVQFAKAGSYAVRLVIAGGKLFATSMGKIFNVTVG